MCEENKDWRFLPLYLSLLWPPDTALFIPLPSFILLFFLTLPSTPFPAPAPLFLEVSTGDVSDEEVEGMLVTCGDRPLLEQGEPPPGKRMVACG